MPEHWTRTQTINALKSYANGAMMSEDLVRQICKQAMKHLQRDRGVGKISDADWTEVESKKHSLIQVEIS